jgi:hypothetical protein
MLYSSREYWLSVQAADLLHWQFQRLLMHLFVALRWCVRWHLSGGVCRVCVASSSLCTSMPSDASVCCSQVVWTGGDKSTSLWCSYSGAFLGTIDRGKELGLPESSSFSRDSQPRSLADEWRAKVDTNKVRERLQRFSQPASLIT